MSRAVLAVLLILLVAEAAALVFLWLKTSELEAQLEDVASERDRLREEVVTLKSQVEELKERLGEVEARALPKEAYQLLSGWCKEKGVGDFYACVEKLISLAESSNEEKLHKVEIVEWYDFDTEPVSFKRVIDGDTVVVDSRTVRIVGYNAFELSEPKGKEGKRVVESLLKGRRLRLDVDDLEPRDKYGRTLGIIWLEVSPGTWCSLTKLVLVAHREIVKNTLHIPPDEHPYWVWTRKYAVVLPWNALVTVRNCTGTYTFYASQLYLTGGVYKVYTDGKFLRYLILLNGSLTVRLQPH